MDSLGQSPVASNAYTTAHVVRLLPDGPDHRSALDWLRRHQHADGSWGGTVPVVQDRLVSTLAAVIALHDTTEEWAPAVSAAGLTWLRRHGTEGRDARDDLIAFEVTVPFLLDQARQRGLPLPYEAFAELPRLREAKFGLIPPELFAARPTTLMYCVEALPTPYSAHVSGLAKFAAANGSLSNNPAATAALQRHTGHRAALDYLAAASRSTGDGGLPEVFPISVFEDAWVLYLLQRAGILPPGTVTAAAANRLRAAALAAGQSGVGVDADFPVPDADDTAMAGIVLQNLDAGGATLLPTLLTFEGPDYFHCFAHERGPAVSANARVLEALARSPEQFGPQLRKATDFLLAARSDTAWWHDKWHLSPYYATAQAVFALADRVAAELRGTFDWLLDTQHPDGSWGVNGGTPEETAYAVLALATLDAHHGPAPRSAYDRARDRLREHLDATRHPELWIGKSLYTPTTVVRAAVLAGFAMASEAADRSVRPDFWKRFPSAVNVHARSAEAHTRAWRDNHGLAQDAAERDRLNRSWIGRSVAKCYPHAPRELLYLAGDTFMWLTAFDDVHAEATAHADPARLARILAQLTDVLDKAGYGQKDGEGNPAHGFPDALADLTIRARSLLPRDSFTRLLSALRGCGLALLWEAHVPWGENDVPLNEYLAMRRHTVFATVMTAFIPRPDAMHPIPDAHRLETSVHNLVGMVNDFCSFRYEQGTSTSAPTATNPLSLPHLLMREKNCTPGEALASLVQMCNEEADIAHRLIARLTRQDNEELRDWADAMAQLVAATDWHVSVTRWSAEPPAAPGPRSAAGSPQVGVRLPG
ncbi:terpene synthase family protein [Actinomadura rubrisoli]|uniref:terpene synthase family protein n=1 Tax=Actinomadura rubrisoli TaxID=2530368 RepID=UPI00140529C0|nr:prenyltransferase/squalene oxidase repeat-containing protein [Actinomadura rubrisoli]